MDWAEAIIEAEKGKTHYILQVLKQDPDLIYTRDAAGETVVHVLAKSEQAITISEITQIVGQPRMQKVLLKQNTNGDTPLHLALYNHDQELAYWLVVVNGEAAWLDNKDGVRPYELIEECGYSKVLKKIPSNDLMFQEFSAVSDIEMGIRRRQIDNLIEEPSYEVTEWIIKSIPRQSREAFLQASNGVIRPREIQRKIDNSGGNILHWAAMYGRVDVLKLLEDFAINTELASLALDTNKDGFFPLHLTFDKLTAKRCYLAAKVRHNLTATALYLIEKAPKVAYFPKQGGKSPLSLGIELGDEDLVRHMFQHMPGTAINKLSIHNLLAESVVHAAVTCKKLGILDIIMKELPECINSLDEQGWRPLSYAAYNGYLDGVRYILNNFPESATKDDTDKSYPIHKAVGGGYVCIVEEFLSSCPSTMYHFDRKGRTILHIAVICKKADVFSYLTKNKQVMEILGHKDHEGKTFVDYSNYLNIGKPNF